MSEMLPVLDTPKKLHEAAMSCSDAARMHRAEGNNNWARTLEEKALELETKAAEMLADRLDAEPTRSVLYRSAGWIAHGIGQLETARELAGKGLAGNPPGWSRAELQELLAACEVQS